MSDFREGIKAEAQEVKADVQVIVDDVREEASEVLQEARAAITGQQLDSANTVGGAGYRAPESQGNGLAVASLVLGILSLICAFLGYGAILGLILGIIGTILGSKARKQAQTGMATGGFVCSLVGLIFSAAGLVCAVACVGALSTLGTM